MRLMSGILFCMVLAFLAVMTAGISEAGEKMFSNGEFVVFKDKTKLAIVDLHSYSLMEKDFHKEFEILDIAKGTSYLALSFHEEFENFLYIYDIKTKQGYGVGIDAGVVGNVWSQTGEFGLIGGPELLVVLPSGKVVTTLKVLNEEYKGGWGEEMMKFIEADKDIIRISGLPLGFFEQKAWVGNYLLYSDAGEEDVAMCWGLLDAAGRKNYFVTCCGMDDTIEYAGSCKEAKSNEGALLREVFELLRSNKLKEVPFDFNVGVAEILREARKKKAARIKNK